MEQDFVIGLTKFYDRMSFDVNLSLLILIPVRKYGQQRAFHSSKLPYCVHHILLEFENH